MKGKLAEISADAFSENGAIGALAGAFILSLTYIPMMSALFLNKNISHKKNISDKMMDILERIHQKYLLKWVDS